MFNQCSEAPTTVMSLMASTNFPEKYAEKEWVRAVVTVIGSLYPPVGPVAAVDNWLATRAQNAFTGRVKSALNELSRQLGRLESTKLDESFFDSAQFVDLLVRLREKVWRTAEREKVALYIRILLRGAQAPPHQERALEYMELLADLSMNEIHVAAAIYNVQRDKPFEWQDDGDERPLDFSLLTSPQQLVDALLDLPVNEIDVYLKRLERTGLVREVPVGIGNPGRLFQATEYFRKMMAYLDVNDLTEAAE